MTACSSKNYPAFSYHTSANPWIDAFKDQVFFATLRKAYQSDTLFTMIEKKDAFNPYDGLTPEDMQKAQQLADNLISHMPPPAMCESCTPGMNYYMAHALHYYQSRELDSVTKAQYRKYKQNEKAFSKALKQ